MSRKFTLYTTLFLVFISIGSGKLSNLFDYIRQTILTKTIKPEKINICEPLQKSIEKYVRPFKNNVSISLLKDNGDFIVNINSTKPRIPASNQKILTSAYALDKLGPDYIIKTSLKTLSNGNFIIQGNGDPDFNIKQLDFLLKELKRIGKSQSTKSLIVILDESRFNWWPNSWTISDRKEEYGSPITKNSLSSNSSNKSLKDPLLNFKNKINYLLYKNKLKSRYDVKLVPTLDEEVKEIYTIKSVSSAPLYVLLSLVNSESHNYTSEVLFRHTENNWNNISSNLKYEEWLDSFNIKSKSFIFADASGLSRNNQLTTFGMTQFLRRMSLNRYSDYYYSSFSVLGLRGTISGIEIPNLLKDNIIAKSGTLNNVKSLSGLIKNKNQYFSIIFNNIDDSLDYIIDILSIISTSKECN